MTTLLASPPSSHSGPTSSSSTLWCPSLSMLGKNGRQMVIRLIGNKMRAVYELISASCQFLCLHLSAVWRSSGWGTASTSNGTGRCTTHGKTPLLRRAPPHWTRSWAKSSTSSATKQERSHRTSWSSTSAPSTANLTVRLKMLTRTSEAGSRDLGVSEYRQRLAVRESYPYDHEHSGLMSSLWGVPPGIFSNPNVKYGSQTPYKRQEKRTHCSNFTDLICFIFIVFNFYFLL